MRDNSWRAIRLAITYAISGIIWIVASDLSLKWLGLEQLFGYPIQTFKGILYVLLTTILVYWLARLAFKAMEQRLLEDQLKKTEDLLKKVLTNLGEAVFIVDPEQRTILRINSAAESIFGFEETELIGASTQILHLNKEEFLRFGKISEPVLDEAGVFRGVFRMKRKDGRVIDTENTIVTIQEDLGWQKGVISIVEDITDKLKAQKELKKSEERYRLLAENTLDVIWAMDMDLKFTFVNPAIGQLTGHAPDAFVGTVLSDHCRKEDFEELSRIIRQEVDKGPGRSGVVVRTRILDKDNSEVPVEVHGKVLFDEQGVPVGIQGTTRDISDRLKAETEKLQLERQLKQSQKMETIGNLAGGIAHDFNNILSAVIGFAELALDDVKKNTTTEDCLQEIYAAGKRARDLVKQILAFARQSDEQVKPVQPSVIAKEVLKFLRSSIPTTIEIHQQINSDSLIMGNATQVHQVFMNLCTNAAHAMEESGGKLMVVLKDIEIDRAADTTHSGVRSGDYIMVSVSDTGAGIPPDVLDLIFEPYFTTKSVGEGTGMGLAMVHGIVESYGGKITVESVLGKGTTFTIYFPRIIMRKTDRPDSADESPMGNERVLFVDDEASIAKMGDQMLRSLGYSITTRTSSVEALELFKSRPNDFDLVVTDMTMPNLTGDQLANELKQIRPDIPVILCTGYSKKISDETAADIGINGFAYKPVVKSDLAKIVRKVLDEAMGKNQ